MHKKPFKFQFLLDRMPSYAGHVHDWAASILGLVTTNTPHFDQSAEPAHIIFHM